MAETLKLTEVFQRGPPEVPLGQLALFLTIAIVLVLAVVVVFLIFYPRLEKIKVTEPLQPRIEQRPEDRKEVKEVGASGRSSIDIVMRLLEPDEKEVVEALVEAGGEMLQKDISRELGISRVKTHRILVRLLRRGVVKVEEHYNTKMIRLADWINLERDA